MDFDLKGDNVQVKECSNIKTNSASVILYDPFVENGLISQVVKGFDPFKVICCTL